MQPHGTCDTGDDTGSHETARKHAAPGRPGRVRLRSLTARAACGVLVAVAALLALPLQAPAQTLVAADWPLIPPAVRGTEKFRLLFVSSAKRNATSSSIDIYNTFIQNLAAAGHPDIQAYEAGFRVVGCTDSRIALVNTNTNGTGVPIYWLNGTKVADNYRDFYNGSWDDEVNDKNELGNKGHDFSQAINYPYTGCHCCPTDFQMKAA